MLGAHTDVSAAVGLSGYYGDLGYRGLRISEQHLCAVADYAAVLLIGSGQEAGNVLYGEQRDVEAVAGPDEPGCLVGSVDVQAARHHSGLAGDDAYGPSAQTDEAGYDVLGVERLNVQDLPVVRQALYNVVHLVGLVGVVRYDVVELLVYSVHRILGGLLRYGRPVALRQIGQELLYLLYAVVFGLAGEVCHAGHAVVGVGAAELFGGDDLAGNGLYYVRSGYEHLAGLLHHEDEVRKSRGIHRAARAGSHYYAYLRNDAGGLGVVVEYAAVACQSVNAFLDAGSAGVVYAYHRSAGLKSSLLSHCDLSRVHLAQRSAHYRKVLRSSVDGASVYLSVAGDHAFARSVFVLHTEVGAAMAHEHSGLLEGAGVEELFETLSCRHLSGLVLLVDEPLAAAVLYKFLALKKRFLLSLPGVGIYADRLLLFGLGSRFEHFFGRDHFNGIFHYATSVMNYYSIISRSIISKKGFDVIHICIKSRPAAG